MLRRQHLLGEHRELHAIWTVLTQKRKGYSRHPESLRWRGCVRALFRRHDSLVEKMARRGYRHRSPLDSRQARGPGTQSVYVDPPGRQRRILREKGCDCDV